MAGNWKITSGTMVVERNNDGLHWNSEVDDYLSKKNRTVYSDIAMPPLAYHEATGPDDEVVVFLNAALFLPHPTLEGTAPVTIYGKCLLDPSDGPDLAQIGRDVASKGDSTLDGVAAGETDDDADDHDVRMLFAKQNRVWKERMSVPSSPEHEDCGSTGCTARARPRSDGGCPMTSTVV